MDFSSNLASELLQKSYTRYQKLASALSQVLKFEWLLIQEERRFERLLCSVTMATLPTFEVNAVERKHLFTIAEQIDKKQCSKCEHTHTHTHTDPLYAPSPHTLYVVYVRTLPPPHTHTHTHTHDIVIVLCTYITPPLPHTHTVSRDEIEQLLYTYRAITGDPNGRIDRIKFRDLLQDHFHMSDDFFMDRVFRAFDKDSDGYLSHEEWVVGMTTFIKGDLDSAIECEQLL